MTRREARRLRKRTERAARDFEQQLLATTPPERTDLPATVVERDGVRYCLYGIAHGQRRSARPGPKLVAAVQKVAQHAGEPATAVLFEGGMSTVMRVDKSLEMAISGDDLFRGLPPRDFLRLAAMLPLALVMGPLLALVRSPMATLLRRALDDPRWLPALREAFSAEEPPEPLGMQTMELTGQGIHVRHSRAMAKAVLAAADRGATTVHVVVGVAHLPHLEWLLTNED